MYKVEFTLSALKDLRRIDPVWQGRICDCLNNLAKKPEDYPGVKHIKGGPHHRFRIRVGDYRVVYDKERQIKILLILRIGHRKEVYRGFK